MKAGKKGLYKKWQEKTHQKVSSREDGDGDDTRSMSGTYTVQLFFPTQVDGTLVVI